LEKELYERIDKRIEELSRIQIREEEDETSEIRTREGSGSDSERGITWSRGSRNYGSSGTVWSEDRLSSRKVDKIRKWVNEKERLERKGNIVRRVEGTLRGVVMKRNREKKGKRKGMDKRTNKK